MPSWPQPNISRVRLMLKFSRVGPDQNFAKFYSVDPKDTSFKKFNLNFFYKNGFWILNLIQIFRLDLNLDPNIWI